MVQHGHKQGQLHDFLNAAGYSGPLSVPAVHAWSLDDSDHFWRRLLDWSGLAVAGDRQLVCDGEDLQSARFFPALRMNAAANLLQGSKEKTAVISIKSNGVVEHLSIEALRDRVERLARSLSELGLEPGDHVAAVLSNDANAVTIALAVAALGGVLATAAPDMGLTLLVDRFADLSPRFLFSNARSQLPLSPDLAGELGERLPSIRAHIAVGDSIRGDVQSQRLCDLLEAAPLDMADWPLFPFNHPLFILFSSGTTGKPKAIVHGAGGTLLEHVKEHRLHCDLGPGDRLFFQTSCAWMMWHWQMSALASGVTIVLSDKGVTTPSDLWDIVDTHDVTVFGASPAFFQLCASTGLVPRQQFALSALRAILSTGSILHEHQFVWLRTQVKDVSIQSISGGTDIIGCFVLGSPLAPSVSDECQSISLGMDVRALGASPDNPVGELVCANPFPSRPLGFHNDPDQSQFHSAYFAQNAGFWTHGDLISLTAAGGARLCGRSDGLLKVRGIRVGPSEIYAPLSATFPLIVDMMVVVHNDPVRSAVGRLILFVVLASGATLDQRLAGQIRRRLRIAASAAHVPDLIVQVAALPVTHSGKRSEAALTDAINGRAVRNLGALKNPETIEVICASAALRLREQAKPLAISALNTADPESIESYISELWRAILNLDHISPDDDFFDLGGNSLSAALLFASIAHDGGPELPLSTLLTASTIRTLTAHIAAFDTALSPQLIELKPGRGLPVFIVHSLAGTLIELGHLRDALDIKRPIIGIEAGGLHDEARARDCVAAMARDYIALIKSVQPEGPYWLCGYSFGGLVAYEMALQLKTQGDCVAGLSLIDTLIDPGFLAFKQRLRRLFRGSARLLRKEVRHLKLLPARERASILGDRGLRLARSLASLLWALVDARAGAASISSREDLPPELRHVRRKLEQAQRCYRPPVYDGEATYIRARRKGPVDAEAVWRRAVKGQLNVCTTAGSHDSMINADVSVLSAILSDWARPRADA